MEKLLNKKDGPRPTTPNEADVKYLLERLDNYGSEDEEEEDILDTDQFH